MKTRIFEAMAGLSLAALVGACAGDVKTIDRTQPNAVAKSQFEGIWYYRAAVVEASPESGETEGITSSMEKVRWEIQEDLLLAYRSYEFVPYAEGLTDQGKDFFGSPVAAFKILKHFNIQRDYNTTTGVENNVIVENDTDAPWHERKYIRVDWTQNLVGGDTKFWIGWQNYPTGYFSGISLTSYYVQGNDEKNGDRPLFTKNYFDVTNVYSLEPDPYYCEVMLLYHNVPRCGGGNVKVRLSFKKVDPADDYESLYYPDIVELHDDAGNAIVLNGRGGACDNYRDPGDCTIQTYPYDQQFGNFRKLRVAFDRERYLTRTGRIYVAGRFDIWKDSLKDSDGSVIPYDQRQAKPVIYYGNVNFPEDMVPAAQKLATFWAKPLNETVAILQNKLTGDGKPDIDAVRKAVGGDMYQFKQNDCNIENVKKYAADNGMNDVVERIVGGQADRVKRGNVEAVCAAIQYAQLQTGKYTLDPDDGTGRPMAFNWQRKGDLRYNFQNYVDPLNTYGPWGVAQFGQDPETGEFIANIANYFGVAGDNVSENSTDVIQWLNGDLSPDALMKGDITRNTVISRRQAKDNNVRSQVRDLLMGHEAQMISESGDRLFAETTPDADEVRFQRMFGGSEVERQYLVTDDLLRAFAGPTLYQPFTNAQQGNVGSSAVSNLNNLIPGEVTEQALAKASPANWGHSLQNNPYMKMVTELGTRAWEMAEFFDPNFSGLAASFKGESRDKIIQFLRTELYAAVEAHEVGHTLGLRHNFEGSMDPLNYNRSFWYKENPDGTITQYWNNKPTKDNPHRGNEYKYASIMDYGFDTPLEGIQGIGAYDEAAIRFFYGQLVDVWDPAKVSLPEPRKYGSWARRCGFNSDFFGLPSLLNWLSPESIPVILSSEPVTNQDGSLCVPVDPNTGLENYDNDTSCDSKIDKVFRELVARMEASAARFNDKSECAIFYNISDLNDVLHKTQNMLADLPDADKAAALTRGAKNVFDARKPVPVKQIIDQRREVYLNPPEFIDPSNPPTTEPQNKGYSWSKYLYQVDYAYCSDLYAQFSNPRCQLWDAGWNFTEATDNHVMRYDRDYVFDHFRRDRANWGSPAGYMARLESRRLFHLVNVYRYYLYTRRTAFDAPLFKDWAAAAYKGLNALERILQTPEPGRYCLDQATSTYELDPTGAQSSCPQEFNVGLGYGGGKYLATTWTNEYYYKPNRVGAYYDKLSAIRMLTSSSGFFVRDLSDLFDRRAFSLGYLRVFEDPMIQRFASLIEGDFTGYQSAVVTDTDGSKYVRYMPFFDEELTGGDCRQQSDCAALPGSTCSALAGEVGQCVGGSVRQSLEPLPKIEPGWSWSLQFMSLAHAIANFSSINDYAPEFFRFTKVAVKGSKEDTEYPQNMAIVEFTDPESRIVYRAPDVKGQPPPGLVSPFPAYYGDAFHRRQGQFRDWGIGAFLLKDANNFVTTKYMPARTACPDESASTQACETFRNLRRQLNEKVGLIDIIRRFNRQAEIP
jgi:uncharacterized protein DUF4953